MTPLITFMPMFVAWRRHMMDFLLTWCGGPMAEDRLLGMAGHLCDILDRVPAHAWRPA